MADTEVDVAMRALYRVRDLLSHSAKGDRRSALNEIGAASTQELRWMCVHLLASVKALTEVVAEHRPDVDTAFILNTAAERLDSGMAQTAAEMVLGEIARKEGQEG